MSPRPLRCAEKRKGRWSNQSRIQCGPARSPSYLQTPIAPDKRFLLSLNYTTLLVNLNSWHNGGCPIRFFVIQYKANGQQD
ncbi:down syndrome cell adhesion molecule [Caerostris extrusa]|uniref:Down syndrome cell adhesion molecule n=1 Tax=Caerostris extrusa TaxID=172846 RepID=A0AAV4WVI6_CAEEX|nr:down syndrome cell adhesion molecule [Caerostris extrusa]